MLWHQFLHVTCIWVSLSFLDLWMYTFHQTWTFSDIISSNNFSPPPLVRNSTYMLVRPYRKVASQLTDDLFTCQKLFFACAFHLLSSNSLIISAATSHLPFILFAFMTSLLPNDKSPQLTEENNIRALSHIFVGQEVWCQNAGSTA